MLKQYCDVIQNNVIINTVFSLAFIKSEIKTVINIHEVKKFS